MTRRKMADAHPIEGDTLKLTGIVLSRNVMGLTLPRGYGDETFDSHIVKVTNIETRYKRFDDPSSDVTSQTLTLLTEDGEETTVRYKGREPIAGNKGESLKTENSQGAEQYYTWEKA